MKYKENLKKHRGKLREEVGYELQGIRPNTKTRSIQRARRYLKMAMNHALSREEINKRQNMGIERADERKKNTLLHPDVNPESAKHGEILKSVGHCIIITKYQPNKNTQLCFSVIDSNYNNDKPGKICLFWDDALEIANQMAEQKKEEQDRFVEENMRKKESEENNSYDRYGSAFRFY